jgi:hypothetical protein
VLYFETLPRNKKKYVFSLNFQRYEHEAKYINVGVGSIVDPELVLLDPDPTLQMVSDRT